MGKKKRRSRSKTQKFADEAQKMSLSEMEHKIRYYLWGFENGGSSQGGRAYFKSLVWMEAQREEVFGIPAPRRDFRARRF